MSTTIDTEKIITYSFCDSFKDKLAEHIQREYADKGGDLSRLAIVFGGKRPAMFLKRDLAGMFKKSYYPPRFFTIDEFMHYTVSKSEPFRLGQDLDNCYMLYRLAQKSTPYILKGREAFAQFLPWIREILKFIDQMDLELIEESALGNIRSHAQIGYDVPEDVNKLLKHIVGLRRTYHDELKRTQTYTRGMQYLRAAHLVGQHDFNEFDQIIFANFFYFHRTEEVVVKSLFERDKATLIFQGDQRKWPVLERISKMFAHPIVEGKQPDATEFKLNVHKGFDMHSQVGLVREILKKTQPKNKTVIVLPNPDHIIPLMSEIGTEIEDYNVSMGYPLKRSSLYMLFSFLFKAQLSAKDGRYYARDYLKVLRHPFVKNLRLSSDMAVARILTHKIEEILTGQVMTDLSGSLYVDLKDIERSEDLYILTSEMTGRLNIEVTKEDMRRVMTEIHDIFFGRWEPIAHFKDFGHVLSGFLDIITEKSFLKKYPLNLNIAAKIYAIKEEFQKAAFAEEHFEKEEMFRIFEQKMDHEFIKFEGSPLKGLQILGLLETRSLNFDNVIILDVNEGTLPSLRIHEPLIPREVMISLGLDRLELEEEIQRYQFMRLISSAKNVHLIYQDSKDKERSRFIEELIWEEEKEQGAIGAVSTVKSGYHVHVKPVHKIVHKTPAMVDFLKNHAYSASSVNMYVRNPMDFYMNYVLGLREQEDLLDEPEARHVGTFIHEVLEESYKPFLNKKPVIDQAFRDHCLNIFERRFNDTFARSMKSDSFLLRSVIAERLNLFLNKEQNEEERQADKVLYLESRFEDTVKLPAGHIKFRYVVDRVDQMPDGTVMIIDYKTGSTDVMPKPVELIDRMELSREAIYEQVKSFQIPLYFHYLNKQFPDAPINAALYNLRMLELHPFLPDPGAVNRQYVDEVFMKALNYIMAEILNPEIPFVEDLTHNQR